VIAGGLALAGAGFAVLTRVDGGSALATLVAGSVLFALGLAPVYTLAADMMVGAAPPERAGAAAGISETSSELGGALGIAMLGAVGAAVYRGDIVGAVPTDAAEAARDTPVAAVAAGDELPGQLGLELVGAARDALTHALQLTATLSAAVAVGAAILAAAFLQRVRTPSGLVDERPLEPDRALASGRPC
jgi:DHA2 family multidrug resistance protein-like MFS transporter